MYSIGKCLMEFWIDMDVIELSTDSGHSDRLVLPAEWKGLYPSELLR